MLLRLCLSLVYVVWFWAIGILCSCFYHPAPIVPILLSAIGILCFCHYAATVFTIYFRCAIGILCFLAWFRDYAAVGLEYYAFGWDCYCYFGVLCCGML